MPIATQYADPDDVDAAMQRLRDLEARDRACGAPGDEVGCGRSGNAWRVARVPRAIPRAPARCACIRSCASIGRSTEPGVS